MSNYVMHGRNLWQFHCLFANFDLRTRTPQPFAAAMCTELCGLLCCFGCLTCCGCRNIVTRRLVFFPPPPMYEFDSGQEMQTMWLTDARAMKICPYSASNFRCFKIPTSKGETIAAFHIKTEGAKYTLLFSHGNATDIGYMRDHLLDMAAALKVDIFAYDYCGYGLSSGQPSVSNVMADVEAAYDYLVKTLKVTEDTIIAYGQSLGGGPTLHISHTRKVRATITHSTFTSGLRVIRNDVDTTHFFDIFANIDAIGKVQTPVLIIHGVQDVEIPVEHGLALYEASNKLYEPWFVDGAGHNDVEVNFRNQYFHKIEQFLKFLDRQSK